MTDGSGTTAWSYDGEGHVLGEKRTIGSVTKTISYTYNAGGSIATITYPSGYVATHEYSTAGRPTAIRNNGMTLYFGKNATYAPSGGLSSLLLGWVSGGFAGITVTNTYNSRLQPVTMTAKHTNDTVTLLNYTYSFVSGSINDGHVKSVTNNLVAGRTQTYTYDEMNRLKTAQSQANSPDPNCWGLSYGYDRYANLLSASLTKCAGPALSLSVDNTTNKITNTGFAYDAAGNLTNDGFSSYTWNAEGRMAATAGVTYTYDGDGRRVSKSNGKLYWYGINGQVLAESDASGNVTSEFIFFGGMRIARRDVPSGNVYYFLGDRLGNARVVTNSTGSVVEESDFYPFGVERPITDTLDNNYKFTQHERDPESGLDHTLYRQLSSAQGRWLSPDPAGGSPSNPQSWNRYPYAGNDPANGVDPSGLLTIVLHGIFSNCGGDFQNGSAFMEAVRDTFGEREDRIFCIEWDSDGALPWLGYHYEDGIRRVLNFLETHPLEDGEQLNFVGHSYGGTLAKLVATGIRHVDNLVTLGMPIDYDIYRGAIPGLYINLSNVSNSCAVSSWDDWLQPLGSSESQAFLWGNSWHLSVWYSIQAWQALEEGDWDSYWQLSEWAAEWWAIHVAVDFSTRWDPWATHNVLHGFGGNSFRSAHTKLHTAGVWNAIKGECGL